MTYIDSDGNEVQLCVRCKHWRATHGDLCELCFIDEEAE